MIERIAFILVCPQMGENIGAAARAMMNFGITNLRLVAPRDGWPNERAIDMGAGAFEHIDVQVFDTLSDAAKGLHKLYATTARSRDMVKPIFTPDAAVDDAASMHDLNIGFVFGPERTGLENEDLSLCHAIINVPTNPAFSSLNLGQCVLLIAYALSRNTHDDDVGQTLPTGDSSPAPHQDIQQFLIRLEASLGEKQFFKSDDAQSSMMRNVRNIFLRNDLTEQEVKTLQGILSALNK